MSTNKDEFSVRELPTQESQNKVFMVSAPTDAKNEVYSPSFWPKGVGYRRFDFNRYRSHKYTQNEDFL